LKDPRFVVILLATLTACALTNHASPSPAFARGAWRIRLDVDSAPSRQVPKQPLYGTINFATAHYSIELRQAISRNLANSAAVVAWPQSKQQGPALYKITLGDSNSFDEKIVLMGRPVTSDSIVGTWSETILCCSAAGRFTLWRSPSAHEATGEIAEVTIPSKTYPRGRHAWVYTPANYPASCQSSCNLIIAFDGALYLGAMPLPSVLDSLIAKGATGPAVAILIDNGVPPARTNDLANSQQFAEFVAEEMLPWVREHYAAASAPDRVLITGSSLGGLAAAYIAMKYPALIGNVFSQSGAFWRGNEASNGPPYEWLTQQFAASPKLKTNFVLEVGTRETAGALGGAAPSLLDANRRLHSLLMAKGYSVRYFEVPNGEHSPETWSARLASGIAALLPARPSR
jgi:enterochelin esterase family protein